MAMNKRQKEAAVRGAAELLKLFAAGAKKKKANGGGGLAGINTNKPGCGGCK